MCALAGKYILKSLGVLKLVQSKVLVGYLYHRSNKICYKNFKFDMDL